MLSVEKPVYGHQRQPLSPVKTSMKGDIKQYRIVECIGRGNFGDVYKAFDLKEHKNVAIKAINLEHSDDEIPVLLQEINLLRSLKHPNITNWYTTFVIDVSMFIVMEYCSEGSCADLLRFNKKGLSEVPLAYVMKSVLHGLSYLHDMNIIHRDIKAANILINSEGEIKLADFGVSGQMEGSSGRKTFVGTPYWMAPEIVTDREGLKSDRDNMDRRLMEYGLGKHTLYKIWKKKISEDISRCDRKPPKEEMSRYERTGSSEDDMDEVEYDEKVDIWSLGVTLIELYTGKVPNNEKEPLKALFDIPKLEPPMVPKDSSYYLKEFCLACMCKDPVMRLSAKELLNLRFITKNKPRLGELKLLTGHGSKLKRRKPKFELNFDTFHFGPNVEWILPKTIRKTKTKMNIKPGFPEEIKIFSDRDEISSSDGSGSPFISDADENLELQSRSTGEDMFSNNLFPPSNQYRHTAETSPIHQEHSPDKRDPLHQQQQHLPAKPGSACVLPQRVGRVVDRAAKSSVLTGNRTQSSEGKIALDGARAALTRLARIDAPLFLVVVRGLSHEFVV